MKTHARRRTISLKRASRVAVGTERT